MLQLKPEGMPLADVVSQPVAVCGRQLVADNSGSLYWPSQRTLVIADLPLQDGPASPAGTGGGAAAASASRRALVKLAETLGLNGTPSYVVGQDLVIGAVGVAALKEKVANARCGKSTC